MAPISFLDYYTELEPWIPMDGSSVDPARSSPTYGISNFSRLAKLSVIMNQVLNQVYSERRQHRASSSMILSLNGLNQQLSHWYQTTPLHLKFSPSAVGREESIPSPHRYAVMLVQIASRSSTWTDPLQVGISRRTDTVAPTFRDRRSPPQTTSASSP